MPAETVHTAAVEMAEEKNLKVVKEKENKYLEVTDGLQTIAYKTEPDGPEKYKLTVAVDIPPEKGEKKEQAIQKEKDFTLQEINNLCKRLNVKPTIIKE